MKFDTHTKTSSCDAFHNAKGIQQDFTDHDANGLMTANNLCEVMWLMDGVNSSCNVSLVYEIGKKNEVRITSL